MSNKSILSGSLSYFIYKAFTGYFFFYLLALVCLFMTHLIQSELPFLAKDIAGLVEGKVLETSTGFYVLLAVGIIIFRTGSRFLFFYPARVLQRDVRVELIEKLEKAPPFRYEKLYPSGEILQITSNDLDNLRGLIGFGLLQIGNIIIALSILIPRLAGFNPRLLIALIPLFSAFVFFTVLVARNRKFYQKTQEYQGQIQQYLVESYDGKTTIQNYEVEKLFINLFNKYSYRELLNFYKAGKNIAFSIPLVPFGVGVSLLWGAHIIFSESLGAEALILFSGFIFLFLEPLMFLSWIGVVFTRAIVSWKRIKKLVLDLDDESEKEKELKTLENHDLRNAYEVMLWGKSLRVAGDSKILGIVGPTGVGKSEVMKQIAYLNKFEGVSSSYVAQEPYLFNDTLERNLLLGESLKSTKDREGEFYQRKLDLALKLLKVFDLEVLTGDPQTLLSLEVGENGKLLSGGQAKRVCLIRSLLSESEVILWDDPFSSVDLVMERKIMEEIKEIGLLKERRVILTTHRLSTLKFCDDYIYLSQKIEEIEKDKTKISLTNENSRLYEHFKAQIVDNI
ncbi:MAG: ABC transporter transmembrane domain-containing protein [Bacteriovoracaceae bacterium]